MRQAGYGFRLFLHALHHEAIPRYLRSTLATNLRVDESHSFRSLLHSIHDSGHLPSDLLRDYPAEILVFGVVLMVPTGRVSTIRSSEQNTRFSA